jgi:3-deoxy-D-manno-octulosonic-acid transferase
VSHPVYTVGLATLMALYAPVAAARRFTRHVPLNLRARLGFGLGTHPTVRRGWVHAVSVGEAIAAFPLVEGLRRLYPELPLVITTVTETGARVARERFSGMATHEFFPLDLPGAVRRVVDAIDPAFLVCVETELWPNVLACLAARDTPVMIANGRISDRSFGRYRLVRSFLKTVLGDVRVFGMQSIEDARRIIALGAPPERVFVTGNLKHEPVADTAGMVDLWHRLLGLAPGQPVWIAGSTHRGEEEAVLDAYALARRTHPDLALILAPRHPERASDVKALVAARGWPVLRRSEMPTPRARDAVLLLDTVGELAQLYAIASVVFVGGSLVPIGGHNMLEPAARRRPVLFGPHTRNFREAAALLVERGAGLVVHDATELGTEVARLVADPDLSAKMGQAGFEAVASRHGAVRETLDLVARFLHPPGSTSG